MKDVVVIGAGLTDLTAAIKAVDAGLSTTLVAKGVGGIQLGAGAADILNYRLESVETLLEAPEGHVASRPTCSYGHVTPDFVGAPVVWLRDLISADALIGDETRDARIPTGAGALRPTCLIPPSMETGISQVGARYAIVGLMRFKDFYLGLIAENLIHQNGPDGAPINARAFNVDCIVREDEVDSTSTDHARSPDHEESRAHPTDQIHPLFQDGEIVDLPAILGLDNPNARHDPTDKLGYPVFGIPVQPSSVPGMRLNVLLTRIASDKCRAVLGSSIRAVHTVGRRISAVRYASAGRSMIVETRSLILAAGGFESGAFDMDSCDIMRETICELPVMGISGQLLHADFWGEDQSLSPAGLTVSGNMRVLSEEGVPVCPNLHTAEDNLAGVTRWYEKGSEGIALTSALAAVDSIVEELK